MKTTCPRCKTDCGQAGRLMPYTATQEDESEGMLAGTIYLIPPDITCAGCGSTLRHTIPFFHPIEEAHWRVINHANTINQAGSQGKQ